MWQSIWDHSFSCAQCLMGEPSVSSLSFGITGVETELLTKGEGLVLRRGQKQVKGEITHMDQLNEKSDTVSGAGKNIYPESLRQISLSSAKEFLTWNGKNRIIFKMAAAEWQKLLWVNFSGNYYLDGRKLPFGALSFAVLVGKSHSVNIPIFWIPSSVHMVVSGCQGHCTL